MVKRKGVGYSIEATLALMTLFIFALGNVPSEPVQDWNNFQKEVAAQDLGHTLKQTGDLDNFLKRRDTGSLKTAVESISGEQLSVSGTIENLPLREAVIGIHRPEGRIQEGLQDPVSCDPDNELEEIDSDRPIRETVAAPDGTRLYIADTDPEDSKFTNGYDTVYVDNGTDCQFSSDEGPFYVNDFFDWSDAGNSDHYEFKNVTEDGDTLMLHDGDRAVSLKKAMTTDVVDVQTKQSFTTINFSSADISNYNILIFDGRDSLEDIRDNREKFDRFIRNNPVILLADLNINDFEQDTDDDLIPDTGLEWVSMGYDVIPGDSVSFTSTESSREVETYFNGMAGSKSAAGIDQGGKVSSSQSATVRDSRKFITSGTGAYDIEEWNSTNSSMKPIDPDEVDGLPESKCVDGDIDGNLTRGTFKFPEHPGHQSGTVTYNVTNIKLGQTEEFCRNKDIRALNIDLDGDGNYSDEGEGPFLHKESLIVQEKRYEAYFPDTLSVKNGKKAEFAYSGSKTVEKINIRRSFPESRVETFVRVPYESTYSSDGRKLLAALVHHLVGDTKNIGGGTEFPVSTSIYGSFQKPGYLPYKASLRWN